VKLELTEQEVTAAIASYLRANCVLCPRAELAVSLTFDHKTEAFGAIVTSDSEDPLAMVVKALNNEYGISFEDLVSRKRSDFHCTPRFLAFYLLRQLGYTTVETGRIFNRDHGSILHGIHNVEDRLPIDALYRQRVERVLAYQLSTND
jgi:chromosomal replication initiation ATPase DnaA